jgi:hypothetical protein
MLIGGGAVREVAPVPCPPSIHVRCLSQHQCGASAGWHRSIGNLKAGKVLEAKPPRPLLALAVSLADRGGTRHEGMGRDWMMQWMDSTWPACRQYRN